ncbi:MULTISPECIES: AbrB/MazE/SpoVT family DNA-binding domain-containing protein [unclassified Bradyrhizobium]|uniref:AbrB/MazE/SpoVT family DNA-binding domain-containing protein n=1 Tax=unclassified Bradyrhizobium TaxID=2631580 RepID=UPI00339293D8
MLVSKWGNSLAVRLPKALVEALNLSPGDELNVVETSTGQIAVEKVDRRAEFLRQADQFRIPLPEGYKSTGTKRTRDKPVLRQQHPGLCLFGRHPARARADHNCRRRRHLTADTHATALALARDHTLAFYDALIVAAAIEAGCETLYSEDMQHGRSIGGLSIVNPFFGSTSPSP